MERNQCLISAKSNLRKSFYALMSAIVFMFIISCNPAASVAGVTIQAVPGLNGLYKQGRPVEKKITVTNDGPAINGYIKLVPKEDEDRPANNMTVYRRSVEIPAQANYKTVMLISEVNGPMKVDVELWKGNSRLAVTKLQGTAVDQGGSVILPLSEKTLQGGLMSFTEKTFGPNNTVKYLPLPDLPTDYFALAVADVIVVERESVSTLKPEQVNVIKEWVKLGGKLILSEGAGSGLGEPFEEFSPTLNGKKAPELLKSSVGRGTVLYSSFGLGKVPASDKQFWESFVKQYNTSDGKNVKEAPFNIEQRMRGGMLVDTSSYIPQLKFPSVLSLAVFWGIYVLIVGPLVYFVLKSRDRRDLAWLVIPVCSLIATVGVFMSSPSQKLADPFGQTLSVVEILDEHLAEVKSAGSFITVKGGLLQVESPPDAMIMPINNYRGRMDQPNVVEIKSNAQEISYRDVEYWSIRQASLYTIWRDYGQIAVDLHLDGERVAGTVKNNTKTNLKNCKIQVAGRLIDMSDLSAGEEVQVSENLAKWPLLNRWGNMGQRQRQERMQQSIAMLREERMLSDKFGSGQRIATQIEFTGWSEQKSLLFEIKQSKKQDEQNNLTLVRQYFQLKLPAGGLVKLPPGIIPAQVTEGNYGEEPGGIVYRGDVTFEYDLNGLFEEGKFVLQTVHICDLPEAAMQRGLKIYNWQMNTWEDVTLDKKVLPGAEVAQDIVSLTGDRLANSLSTEKRLRLKLTGGGKEPKTILPPAMAVEGVTQ